MRSLRILALFLGITLLLAGCSHPASAPQTKENALRVQVGQPAPEIQGTDSSGQTFKLSDFRGKVVVIDFWASYCNPCMALVPHGQALVKRLEGKPFVLLGVNRDESRDLLKATEKAKSITWRSWHDGIENDEGGPISKAWGVKVMPTMFVIDAKGIIRYTDLATAKEMEEAVEKLLQEMEQDQGGKKSS
jgi:thiol-disulfide isomerase/thioredoxin